MPNNFQPHVPDFQRGERLSAARLNELADAIAKLLWHKQQAANTAFGVKPPLEIIGKLNDDLPAATDFAATPGEAVMTVWVKDIATGNLIATNRVETIKQRFETAEDKSAGEEVRAAWIEGEWVALPSGGGRIKEGLMVSCLGDGWYEIEEATFTDEPAGFTYSGITGVDDGCNLCTVADIDTTVGSACESPAEVVLNRTRPTGLGTFVYAHDARRIPIRSGGHVRMLPIHHADNGEQLYAIVSAEYRLVKDPRPDYECCDGTVTLVGCSWIIHEGIACAGWTAECPS